MNKSQQLKSRLIYINEMTLYVTYMGDEDDQLVVALSIWLEKSHVMTDNMRYFNKETGKFTSVPTTSKKAQGEAPTTA